MKALLDRLMARQAKLLANLHDNTRKGESAKTTSAAQRETAYDAAADEAARQTATALIEAGDLRGARAALDPFAATSRSVGTLTTFSRICTDQGDLDSALAALERAEALDPADKKTWRLKAKLLAAFGRHQEALVYLRRLAVSDPGAPAVAQVDLLRGLLRTFAKPRGLAAVERAFDTELARSLDRYRQAPGRDARLDQQFASLFYLLTYGSPTALQLYTEAAPCPPSHRDVTSALLPLGRLAHAQESLPDESGAWALHVLHDVQIHPALGWLAVGAGGEAMESGHAFGSGQFHGVNPRSPLMMFRGSHAELRLPRDVRLEPGPALLLGGSPSCYDTLVHVLPRLAVAEKCGAPADIALVVPAHMHAYQREWLSRLGYAGRRLVEVSDDAPVQFARLHVPTRVSLVTRQDAALLGWYRSRVTEHPSAPTRKLYLLPGTEVEIANGDAVRAMFESHGYESIDALSLPVERQLALFAQATAIAGTTSDGMTNLVFTPAASVLELRPVHWIASGGRMHFERLAHACGHTFAAEECARLGASDGAITIMVDLPRLSRRLAGSL